LLNRIFLLAITLVILNSNLGAQSYFFRKYQVEYGLSNNATICSVQDKKGFLWFGTKDGLNRFDGYSFKIFRNDADDSTSIGNNFIHSLFEDEKGVLWVGTESGLYKYNAATERFSLVRQTVNTRIRDIKMDATGNLWFILGFTLTKYNEAANSLMFYDVNNYFEATAICTSLKGKLWAASSAGLLYEYDNVSNSFVSHDLFQHSKKIARWIERIYSTSDGNILVGTSNQGAKLYDVATKTYTDILTYNKDKTEIFARSFVEVSPTEYWIGTETGIFIYNPKLKKEINLQKKLDDPYSLSDNAIYSFCKDKEGGIWVSTYFGGINYYPKQHTPFKKYFPRIGENSLNGNVVREIHQDNEGNFWIGTEDAGLNKLDAATGQFQHFLPGDKGSISYTNIHGLLVNGNDLWIGTFEHGLDIMDIRTGKVKRHYARDTGANGLQSNFIYCIAKINNDQIILGTTRGAYLYNRTTDNFSVLKGMPLNNWYTALLKDTHGFVWAGTYGNGINYYNTVTGTSGNFRYEEGSKNSLSNDRVNSIFEDSDKNLWFSTEGGLCQFNRQTNDFTRYTTRDGFPSNFFLSILEDGKKNLWISTSKGLATLNLRTKKVTVYTALNGILNDQFNFNSAYKDNDGRMYFGSVKGLISFHPEEFVRNEFVPPLYITGLQVFNTELAIGQNGSPLKKSIINTDKITLKHDQSTISIDFASLSFTAPDMSEYAYIMEGLDKRWTALKQNRKAYFTDLSPGTYVFRVKAANSSGVWNDRETKLTIEILPPWWASKMAYAIYALIGLLLIYLGVRYYHNLVNARNRRKFELLEIAKEKEIFEAKIDFFTNVAHEIRTPLTLIKAPLEKVIKKLDSTPEVNNYLRIMERNTDRLIDLTTQLLDFRQTEIHGFSLNFIWANVTELLEDTYASFTPLAEQKNLLFKLKVPKEHIYAYVDLDAFNKILFNLFNNAVKYADKKAFINLLPPKEEENFFSLEVKNDGFIIPDEMAEKIFEPFFRLKQTEKQKGTGIGLALSLSLVQLHKGTLVLKKPENELNIFVLTLPINQNNKFQPKTTTDTLTNGVNKS
jgi:ligand-binding sensor domain-containing protein/signal transduction histidine kinase